MQRPAPDSADRVAGFARRTVGRVSAALLAAVCCVPLFLGATAAHADDVTDLDARAQQIAVRLDQLQGQVAQIGEQFNQLQIRKQQLADQKSDLTRRRAAAAKTVEARRADAARFALAAYVGGNGDDVLPLALDGRQWDLTRRNGYAAIEIGDRQQVVDDLVAAQRVDADLLDSIHAATNEQEQVAADLTRRQAEASRLIDEQERLQSQVKGELAAAVARQQAALQAEAQAKAQARFEAQFGTPPASETATSPTNDPTSPTIGGESGSATTVPTTRPSGTGSQTSTTAPAVTPPPATTPPVTTPSVTPPPPPSSGGKGQIAANAALSQLGVRYSWGGGNASGPSYGFGDGAGIKGFDCSGLTLYAWAQAGVSLYHSAQMQYDTSRHLAISQLQVGDLVFYGTSSTNISHVGLYIGNGQVVHAPNSRSVVQTGPVYLWGGYFAWVGAGRPG